ncbi:hypothetical protein Mapa_007800 [Marchantia paleacea]|nr:hypothetical protein Mapa_007800 [Marchantia paleacea]
MSGSRPMIILSIFLFQPRVELTKTRPNLGMHLDRVKYRKSEGGSESVSECFPWNVFDLSNYRQQDRMLVVGKKRSLSFILLPQKQAIEAKSRSLSS